MLFGLDELQVHNQIKAYCAFVAEAFFNKLSKAPIYHGNEWQETLWSLNFKFWAFLIIRAGKKNTAGKYWFD